MEMELNRKDTILRHTVYTNEKRNKDKRNESS